MGCCFKYVETVIFSFVKSEFDVALEMVEVGIERYGA